MMTFHPLPAKAPPRSPHPDFRAALLFISHLKQTNQWSLQIAQQLEAEECAYRDGVGKARELEVPATGGTGSASCSGGELALSPSRHPGQPMRAPSSPAIVAPRLLPCWGQLLTSAPSTPGHQQPLGGRSGPGVSPTCTPRGLCSRPAAAAARPQLRPRSGRAPPPAPPPLRAPRAPAVGRQEGAPGPAPGKESPRPRACAARSQATPRETIAGAASVSREAISRGPGALHGDARRPDLPRARDRAAQARGRRASLGPGPGAQLAESSGRRGVPAAPTTLHPSLPALPPLLLSPPLPSLIPLLFPSPPSPPTLSSPPLLPSPHPLPLPHLLLAPLPLAASLLSSPAPASALRRNAPTASFAWKTLEPRFPLPTRMRVSADGCYSSLCTVSSECQVIPLEIIVLRSLIGLGNFPYP